MGTQTGDKKLHTDYRVFVLLLADDKRIGQTV